MSLVSSGADRVEGNGKILMPFCNSWELLGWISVCVTVSFKTVWRRGKMTSAQTFISLQKTAEEVTDRF